MFYHPVQNKCPSKDSYIGNVTHISSNKYSPSIAWHFDVLTGLAQRSDLFTYVDFTFDSKQNVRILITDTLKHSFAGAKTH